MNVYGGMVLGRVGFVKDVLSRLKENDLSRKDVSHRRALKTTWEAEAVIDALCAYFDSSREDLLNGKKRDQRNIALYFGDRKLKKRVSEILSNVKG